MKLLRYSITEMGECAEFIWIVHGLSWISFFLWHFLSPYSVIALLAWMFWSVRTLIDMSGTHDGLDTSLDGY